MPYTIDPTNPASPPDGVEAGYAAAEFRALKGNVMPRLTTLEGLTAPYNLSPAKGLPVGNIFASVVSGPLGANHVLCGDGTWKIFTGAVTSVFGRAGVVVAATGDYSVGQITGAAPLVSPALTGTPTINGKAAGYKGTPIVGGAQKTTSYTPVVADSGFCVDSTAGVTAPASVFPAGEFFKGVNSSNAAVTITQGGGLTMYLSGTTSTGNRTVSARGEYIVWYRTPTEAYISGTGVS